MTEWLGCRSGSRNGWGVGRDQGVVGVLVRIREWLGCRSG